VALYDRIGPTYDATRRADPAIVERLARMLALDADAPVCLDVACGTGNYTSALAARGARIIGIDISERMLSAARAKNGRVGWCRGNAEALPFRAETFGAAVCTLAIHHMRRPWRAFAETHRVMRRGRFVIFSADPAQMSRYWLNEYFPRMMEKANRQMPPSRDVAGWLSEAGFTGVSVERWDVSEALQDAFLYFGKYRPEVYLDPAIRAGISTFADLAENSEVKQGCRRLAADISSGRFAEVAHRYANRSGDYIFIAANRE
jgi:SAM-dependent methyltransferase